MKIVYLLLFVSLNALANISVGENSQIASLNVNTEDPITVTSAPKPKSNSISGLKIVSCESQKYGKHIYIVSDIYTKKKAAFYNEKGEFVYSVRTVGSPIYLSKLDKGTYTVKIKEGKKSETREIVVQ